MADRVPLVLQIELEGFTAKVVVPYDMTPTESRRVRGLLLASLPDPSEAAKYAVADPCISPEITL
jgi:hypothetical protein